MLKEAAQFPKIVSHYLKVFDLEKMTSAWLLNNFFIMTFSFLSDVYQSTEKSTKINHNLSYQTFTYQCWHKITLFLVSPCDLYAGI